MDDTLLKYCKYYKGEEQCPFKDAPTMYFWEAEMRFINISNNTRFVSEEYVKTISDCAPEIKEYVSNKQNPLISRAIVAFAVDDITYHSPMSDTSYFSEYGK